MNKQFDPKKLEKLNNPERLKMIPPEYIWNKLKPKKYRDIVEIGAGTGFFSRAFQDLSGTGTTIAIDVSEIMINWMNENITEENPNIIPLKTNGSVIPLEDSSADIVFMITLHHELDNPSEMLNESHRLLRENGKIFIIDWNKQDLQYGPPKDIRCNPEDVAGQLETAGFKKIETDNSLKSFFLLIAER